MPDILTRIKSAVAVNNAAQVMNLMPELMDAEGKTVFEPDIKIGETIWFQNYENADKSILYLCDTVACINIYSGIMSYRTDRYDICFPDYAIGKTVFLTESAAKDALEGVK